METKTWNKNQTYFLAVGLTIFELWVMETELWAKQPLNFLADNIASWATFCNWDGSIIISNLLDWIFCLKGRDGFGLFSPSCLNAIIYKKSYIFYWKWD